MQRLEEEAEREAEEKRKEEERLAEEKRKEEERKWEEERVAEEEKKELAERREHAALAALHRMGTTEPLGSKPKIYKSTAIVRYSLEEDVAPEKEKEKEKGSTPRGVKRTRRWMIGWIGDPPGGDSNPGSGDNEDDDDEEEGLGPSNKTPCVQYEPKPASSVTDNDNDAVGRATTRRGGLAPNG
ncbi:hypothetical protein F5050DRAFT_1715970 [Lentinula boryana]|uniref:Uncharacterized protein n=1 Tax=Lentinula boryana TaxID=40481 RepID=A0ABQ8PYQ4_9AGAR|nr:hypothetical protein F5050DRAFT_1715970 [Lentinula boryana]